MIVTDRDWLNVPFAMTQNCVLPTNNSHVNFDTVDLHLYLKCHSSTGVFQTFS